MAKAAIVHGVRNRMLSEGLKMTSVGLDLCLGAGQSLKQEIYLVILFNTLSAVNALRVQSLQARKYAAKTLSLPS